MLEIGYRKAFTCRLSYLIIIIHNICIIHIYIYIYIYIVHETLYLTN